MLFIIAEKSSSFFTLRSSFKLILKVNANRGSSGLSEQIFSLRVRGSIGTLLCGKYIEKQRFFASLSVALNALTYSLTSAIAT